MRNKNDNIHKNEVHISDDQTNIDRYRLATNITEYHIISKLILQRIIIKNFCGPESHLRKVQYRIAKSKKTKLFKSVHIQEI